MRFTLAGIILASLVAPCFAETGTFSGDYPGQAPPGRTPELFAPGVVSVEGRHEYGVAWSPVGKQCGY